MAAYNTACFAEAVVPEEHTITNKINDELKHIIDYMVRKLEPEVYDNGAIDVMIDPFMYSLPTPLQTNFAATYKKYLDTCGTVNWNTEYEKLFMASYVPADPFTYDFEGRKFPYVVSKLPPDDNRFYQSIGQTARDKIMGHIEQTPLEIQSPAIQRQYEKLAKLSKAEKMEREKNRMYLPHCSNRIQQFAKDHELNGYDKESCALILVMELLGGGGTAIVMVTKEMLWHSAKKDLRRCLIENFNVREIISIGHGFDSMQGMTIIIFDNTDVKTTQIAFKVVDADLYPTDRFGVNDRGEVVILHHKNDIFETHNRMTVYSLPKDKILNHIINPFTYMDRL